MHAPEPPPRRPRRVAAAPPSPPRGRRGRSALRAEEEPAPTPRPRSGWCAETALATPLLRFGMQGAPIRTFGPVGTRESGTGGWGLCKGLPEPVGDSDSAPSTPPPPPPPDARKVVRDVRRQMYAVMDEQRKADAANERIEAYRSAGALSLPALRLLRRAAGIDVDAVRALLPAMLALVGSVLRAAGELPEAPSPAPPPQRHAEGLGPLLAAGDGASLRLLADAARPPAPAPPAPPTPPPPVGPAPSPHLAALADLRRWDEHSDAASATLDRLITMCGADIDKEAADQGADMWRLLAAERAVQASFAKLPEPDTVAACRAFRDVVTRPAAADTVTTHDMAVWSPAEAADMAAVQARGSGDPRRAAAFKAVVDLRRFLQRQLARGAGRHVRRATERAEAAQKLCMDKLAVQHEARRRKGVCEHTLGQLRLGMAREESRLGVMQRRLGSLRDVQVVSFTHDGREVPMFWHDDAVFMVRSKYTVPQHTPNRQLFVTGERPRFEQRELVAISVAQVTGLIALPLPELDGVDVEQGCSPEFVRGSLPGVLRRLGHTWGELSGRVFPGGRFAPQVVEMTFEPNAVGVRIAHVHWLLEGFVERLQAAAGGRRSVGAEDGAGGHTMMYLLEFFRERVSEHAPVLREFHDWLRSVDTMLSLSVRARPEEEAAARLARELRDGAPALRAAGEESQAAAAALATLSEAVAAEGAPHRASGDDEVSAETAQWLRPGRALPPTPDAPRRLRLQCGWARSELLPMRPLPPPRRQTMQDYESSGSSHPAPLSVPIPPCHAAALSPLSSEPWGGAPAWDTADLMTPSGLS